MGAPKEEGTPLLRLTAYEVQGLGIQNPRPVVSISITEEMWASVCEKAAAAGMDPRAYFDRMLSEAGAADSADPDAPTKE